MEINVTKNLLTGEKTVVSTATVPAEEVKRHAGLKVYDDGRKCVYALNSREVRSDEQDRASPLLEAKVTQQPMKKLPCGCYRNENNDANLLHVHVFCWNLR